MHIGNKIGDEEAKALGDALNNNSTLTTLYLSISLQIFLMTIMRTY